MGKWTAISGTGNKRDMDGAEIQMYILNNGNIIWYYTPRQSGRKYRAFNSAKEAAEWMYKHKNYIFDLMGEDTYIEYMKLIEDRRD